MLPKGCGPWYRAISLILVRTPAERGHAFGVLLQTGGFSRQNSVAVFRLFKPKNRDEHRYYLLPGMGRSNRRQRQFYFRCALVFGFFIAAIIGAIIYLAQRPGPSLFR